MTDKAFRRLPKTFFQTDGITLARHLLGKHLIRQVGNDYWQARIVETEAYMGAVDRASHAYGNRRTPRTETMFAGGGTAYVYLIYGMYHCLNVVASSEGIPEAVLIRAVEPIDHVDALIDRRQIAIKSKENPNALKQLTNGPGKLCMAYDINRTMDGCDLAAGEGLYIADGSLSQGERIAESPRINIDYAGEDKHNPWRFFIENNIFVSK
jgi:DNA-3-methyladenine glycosylase